MAVFSRGESYAPRKIAEATEKFNGKFDYSLVEYTGKDVPVLICCPEHGIFQQRLYDHVRSTNGCKQCANKANGKRCSTSQEEVIRRFNEVHDNIEDPKFDYSSVKYENMHKKVELWCLVHGPFWQKPSDHLNSHGCPNCKGDKCKERRKVPLDKILGRFEEKHEGKYTYPDIESYYVDSSTIINIECEKHGIFTQTAHSHLYGGCAKCGKDSLSAQTKGVEKPHRRTTIEKYITKANEKHDYRYEYDKTVYVKSRGTKIIVTCKEHGDFEISPRSHLTGWGCRSCSLRAMGQRFSLKVPELVNKLNVIHDFKYDYSKVVLVGDTKNVPITVICPNHGEFSMLVGKHYTYGCPECEKENPKVKNSCVNGSKPANAWLDSLGIELVREFRLPEKRTRPVDGYCINTNTIYQFHGDYYHGNPAAFEPSAFSKKHNKTFGELYEHSCRMDQEIIDFGYNLVVMWEYDWSAKVKEEKRIVREAKKLQKKLKKKARKK
jgi:hypothetical protein